MSPTSWCALRSLSTSRLAVLPILCLSLILNFEPLIAPLCAQEQEPKAESGSESGSESKPVAETPAEKPTPAPKAASTSTSAEKEAELVEMEEDESGRDYTGRLPNYWNRLNLSEAQKEKIYSRQLAVKAELDPLEKELDELRKRTSDLRKQVEEKKTSLRQELLAVLTEDQKKQLIEVIAAAAREAISGEPKTKKRRTKKSDESDPSDTPTSSEN